MEYLKNSIDYDSSHFKFGIALFETIKIKEGRSIFLNEHIDRIYKGLDDLNIKKPVEKNILKKDLIELSKGIKDSAIRITINEIGVYKELRPIIYIKSNWNKGLKLCLSPIKRGESVLYNYKTSNYFENIYSKNYANQNGFDDSIFLNLKNEVLETSVANIFFSKDQKIYTPSLKLGLLDGIIRNKIIQICNELKIEIIQDKIKFEDLKYFDGCFITNSLMNINVVNKIESINFSENKIFSRILNKLEEMEYER